MQDSKLQQEISVVQVVQDGGEEGNTSTSSPHGIKWTFTLPANSVDTEELLSRLSKESDHWIFQKESGESTGYEHYQGYVEFRKDKRFKAVKKILGNSAHVEKVKGTRLENIKYCSKPETRIDGPWSSDHDMEPVRPLEYNETLIEWHAELDALLTEPRWQVPVIFIVDPTGGTGKSSYTRKKMVTQKGFLFFNSNASKDVACCIQKMVEKEQMRIDLPYKFIFDLPRNGPKNYAVYEMLKNGMIFSAKYESCGLIFQIPWIIVFTNEEPQVGRMSDYKYKVYNVKEGHLVESTGGAPGGIFN